MYGIVQNLFYLQKHWHKRDTKCMCTSLSSFLVSQATEPNQSEPNRHWFELKHSAVDIL